MFYYYICACNCSIDTGGGSIYQYAAPCTSLESLLACTCTYLLARAPLSHVGIKFHHGIKSISPFTHITYLHIIHSKLYFLPKVSFSKICTPVPNVAAFFLPCTKVYYCYVGIQSRLPLLFFDSRAKNRDRSKSSIIIRCRQPPTNS